MNYNYAITPLIEININYIISTHHLIHLSSLRQHLIIYARVKGTQWISRYFNVFLQIPIRLYIYQSAPLTGKSGAQLLYANEYQIFI